MRPFFSVVIATYNRSPFLCRALDSLLGQTETDWEAWIIDDGSTDDTEDIIEKYLQAHTHIFYKKIKKSGEAAAKNTGIAFSNGQYITFLDSDDAYKPDHLEIRKSILENNPQIDFLHGGIQVVGDAFVPDIHNPGKLIHISECVAGATFVLHKRILADIQGFEDMPIGNDADLFARVVDSNLNIYKTDHPSYIYYRDHAGTITSDIAGKRK